MPTPSEPFVNTKETMMERQPTEVSVKSSSSDPDVELGNESFQRKKQQPQNFQSANYHDSPRHKFVNLKANNNHQNGGRNVRNNSVAKRSTSDTNNNNSNKVFNGFKAPNVPPMQNEYQQKLPNGHVDPPKKPNAKFRSITKSSQTSNYYEDLSSRSMTSEESKPAGSGHLKNAADIDSATRKYSMDFLHKVGYKMSNFAGVALPQHSPKNQKQVDDANLMALKIALGDNSGYYNHFYSGAMYGNQLLLQQQHQQQFQHQSFSRYQQPQQQQQMQQRLQRMYQRGQQENFQRVYHQPVYHEEPAQLACHCPQPGQQQFQRNYQFSQSYQNRNKGERRDYRDNNNSKKTRHGNNSYNYQNGGGSERNHKSNNKNAQLSKSNSFNEEDSSKRRSPAFNGMNSEEHAYRSLSPTPPGSSKSSSPGAQDKCIDKDAMTSSGVNFELADDSASTASASSSSGPSGTVSYVGEMKVSLSAPILLAEEPSTNVNNWIDINFGGSLHNGLSYSAENIRDVPITIIKRPPSVISHSDQFTCASRLAYDPQNPCEHYLSRAEETQVRGKPNLRCSSKFDRLSEEMWDRFQNHQQSCGTYRKKMLMWQDLRNAVKSFPMFHQKAFPKWGLYLVGSTISGFGSDYSDIDMCLVFKGNHPDSRIDLRMEAIVVLNDLKNHLINSLAPFQSYSLINAKVPILRFCDKANEIEIDLNYNNCIGVRNTHLLYSYSQIDWRLRPLALTVKLWAQFHNINDARNSTISSYSLVLMVIHFLQYAVTPAVLPCLHLLCPEKFQTLHDITTIDIIEKCDVAWKSENRQPLGELFVRFLDYYSNFDYATNAISVRTGGVLPIEECKSARSLKNDPNHWQTLCIEEPFDLTNTARSAYDFEIFSKIKEVFFSSWYMLKETRSLLSVFNEPLFSQQQQLLMNQYNQIKYMPVMSNGSGTSMAPVSDVKS